MLYSCALVDDSIVSVAVQVGVDAGVGAAFDNQSSLNMLMLTYLSIFSLAINRLVSRFLFSLL